METTKKNASTDDDLLPPDAPSHVHHPPPSDDAKTDQDSFLMFASVIVGLIVLAYTFCLYQMFRIWICRICCGRDVVTRDVTLILEGENADAQIFSLNPRQRRAVLEAIFSETSKAVTEDDVYKNKLKRKNKKKLSTSFDSSSSEDDVIHMDVQIPTIATMGTNKSSSCCSSDDEDDNVDNDSCGDPSILDGNDVSLLKSIEEGDGIDCTTKTWPSTKSSSWNDLSDELSAPARDRTMTTTTAATTTSSTTSTRTDTSPQQQQQQQQQHQQQQQQQQRQDDNYNGTPIKIRSLSWDEGVKASEMTTGRQCSATYDSITTMSSGPCAADDDNVTPRKRTLTNESIPQNINKKNHHAILTPSGDKSPWKLHQQCEDNFVVTPQQQKTPPAPSPASFTDSKRKNTSSSDLRTIESSSVNEADQVIAPKSSFQSLQSPSSMDECDYGELMPLDYDKRHDLALPLFTDDDNDNDKKPSARMITRERWDKTLDESKEEIPDHHPPQPSSELSLGNSTAGVTLVRMDSFTTTSEYTEYTYDDETEGILCSICLSGYQEGNIIIASKYCTHLFHKECILEWLGNHDECPVCRVGMVTAGEINKAATSVVGKTRMYKAVASLNASVPHHRLVSLPGALQRRGGTSSPSTPRGNAPTLVPATSPIRRMVTTTSTTASSSNNNH